MGHGDGDLNPAFPDESDANGTGSERSRFWIGSWATGVPCAGQLFLQGLLIHVETITEHPLRFASLLGEMLHF